MVESGFGLGCLACSFAVVRALPPGSFPVCSPWLLDLWPELLWLSWASVWVALPVRSFLFWIFLSRFLHCRRSLLGFGLRCPSVRATVWVAAWMFVFEATFPLRFVYSVQSNRPRLPIPRVWGPGGGLGYRPSLANSWCRHSLTKKKLYTRSTCICCTCMVSSRDWYLELH